MKEILARFHALDHEPDAPNHNHHSYSHNPDNSDSDHSDGQEDNTRGAGSVRDLHQQQLQLRGMGGGGGGGSGDGSDLESGSGSDGEGEEGGGGAGAAAARVVGVDPVADALSEQTLQRLFIKVGVSREALKIEAWEAFGRSGHDKCDCGSGPVARPMAREIPAPCIPAVSPLEVQRISSTHQYHHCSTCRGRSLNPFPPYPIFVTAGDMRRFLSDIHTD